MTTSELIKQLAQKLNITQKDAKRLLNQELDAIGRHLSEDKNVIVRGFGTLGLRDVRATKAEPIQRKTVFFRASKKLKDMVKSWRPS